MAQMTKFTATPAPKSRQSGFTLIEVMVALFIFALGVTSLVVAQTDSLKTTAVLEERLYAEIVAENQLVAALTSVEDLELGFTYGDEEQAGRLFSWSRQVRPSGSESIQWVEINVRLKADNPIDQPNMQVLYTLSGFRRDV